MKRSSGSSLNVISWGWNTFFCVILMFMALLVVVPMILVFIVSFSAESSIARVGFSFTPLEWSLDGYRYLFKTGTQLGRSYLVTIFYTVTATVMSLSVMSMYAYVISLKNFRAHKLFTWILFFTMLFGGGLVPSYIMNVNYLHLNDTVWIFLLPGLVSAYNVIILRTFIQTTIPDSLFEAARIDGASHFKIFLTIVIPLFGPGLATIGLFKVVGVWNDWFTGMLYITAKHPELVPLQTMLQKLQDNIDFLKKNAAIAGTPEGIAMMRSMPDQNMRMACTVVVIVPMLAAYPFFQRFFVNGLTMGSVKE